jgi:hypothetical protein
MARNQDVAAALRDRPSPRICATAGSLDRAACIAVLHADGLLIRNDTLATLSRAMPDGGLRRGIDGHDQHDGWP